MSSSEDIKLPEPTPVVNSDPAMPQHEWYAFDAKQMREYGRLCRAAGIEEAAKVCDAQCLRAEKAESAIAQRVVSSFPLAPYEAVPVIEGIDPLQIVIYKACHRGDSPEHLYAAIKAHMSTPPAAQGDLSTKPVALSDAEILDISDKFYTSNRLFDVVSFTRAIEQRLAAANTSASQNSKEPK